MTTQQQWESASIEEKKVDLAHHEGDNASAANVLIVTPEDVSIALDRLLWWRTGRLMNRCESSFYFTGQARMSIDRQEVASHPRLGLFPPDFGQILARSRT
jgi:hypothetical protein